MRWPSTSSETAVARDVIADASTVTAVSTVGSGKTRSTTTESLTVSVRLWRISPNPSIRAASEYSPGTTRANW